MKWRTNFLYPEVLTLREGAAVRGLSTAASLWGESSLIMLVYSDASGIEKHILTPILKIQYLYDAIFTYISLH